MTILEAEKSFQVYNDNSVHTTLEFFKPSNEGILQDELVGGVTEQYRKYKSFAVPFIEAAVLKSVDGSSELGILEHYKLNTDFPSLTDPAVYPESTSVIEGIEKVSVYAEWLLCEAVTALSSSQLLQTLQKDDIVHIDVITIGSSSFESVYSETHKTYSRLVNDINQLLSACTIFKLPDSSKLIIVGSWQSLPVLNLTELIPLENDKESVSDADQAKTISLDNDEEKEKGGGIFSRQMNLYKVVDFV
ncbi:hypothetical protein O6H91_08G036000 [Diphasiastrum complanatum]|uniref:Uncharacterized protein n=1 Tax=Diphasiastrum complanatum TaxID=34168 RepID=A0ACC2CWG8_DIPCM|nr:hypothetical protein O6H91_08G036000 [Diphasiastrum complanatum]